MEIPAGWSQIPLAVETPFQLETGLANTQLAQTKAQEAADLAPIQTQLAQNELAASNAAAPVSQLDALSRRQTLEDQLLGEAAARAQSADNPAQAWRDSMTALAAEGVTRASQLDQAGYSDRLAKTVAAFGGPAVAKVSQLAATGGAAGAPGSLSQYGQYDQQIDQMLSNTPPAQQAPLLQQKLGVLDQIRQAIAQVRSAPDPIAAWDQHAAQFSASLGIPNAAGMFAGNHAGLEAKLDELQPQVEGYENALQSRLARGALGIPNPAAPAQIEKTSEGDYAVRPDGKGGFTSTPITPIGKAILVGRTDEGKGVYFNPTTQTETVGNVNLGNKPGTARDTATMEKYQLLTAAGMSPEEAGMVVAGARQMQPAEIVSKAQQLAAQQVTAEEGGMGSPGFLDKVQTRAQQIQAQLTSANAISVPTPGAPAAPANPPAPTQDYGPTPGKGIDPGVKLKALSADPAKYRAARDQLVRTGNWQAFDQVFGQGAASRVMAVRNRNTYSGP